MVRDLRRANGAWYTRTEFRALVATCRGRLKPLALLTLLLCVLLPLRLAAQNVQHSKGSQDLGLRHDFSVDPVSLSLNVQITLGAYRWRGGTAMPVALRYSSKVWRLDYAGYNPACGPPLTGCTDNEYTTLDAVYGDPNHDTLLPGWSSTLQLPYVVSDPEWFTSLGKPCDYDRCGETGADRNKIMRVRLRMPDGSAHELRAGDDTHPADYRPYPVTYHAVDDSRLVYKELGPGQTVTYLPDGSRYETGIDGAAGSYVDRHGNRLNFDGSAWTDALGRSVSLDSQPGFGDTSINYTYAYRQLKVAGHPEQSALTDYDQTLAARGTWDGNTNNAPGLFGSGSSANRINAGDAFNPSVLYQITSPDGSAYTFTYNVYGEIDKIVYPTGGYERFVYGAVPGVTAMNSPYTLANRGVKQRFVSPDGTAAGEQEWGYDAVEVSTSVLKTVTVAPDGTVTERFVRRGLTPDAKYFDFDEARAGMVFEERFYAAGARRGQKGELLRRKLTEWGTAAYVRPGIVPGGYRVTSNPHINRQVEVLLDTGGDALSKTTEYGYDADLNVTSTLEYDFARVTQSAAQAGEGQLDAIGAFPAGELRRQTETTYLVNDPAIIQSTRDEYRARNLVSLPTAAAVRDAADNVVSRSETKYDEPAYPVVSCPGIQGWTNPQTAARGDATTSRSWLDTDNVWVETHAVYDQAGNVRKTRDAHLESESAHGDATDYLYTSAYQYAYLEETKTPAPDPTGAHGSAARLTSSSTYDVKTGLVKTATDANKQVTRFYYTYADGDGATRTDPLSRLRRVEGPDGGRTTYEYGNTPLSFYVRTRAAIDAGRSTDAYQYFDGLGRPGRAFTWESQDAANPWLTADTLYDAMGRAWRVSNPYRSAGPGSALDVNRVGLEKGFDALGRVTRVKTTADGAVLRTDYSGDRVLVTDQAGRQRISKTDGLGRLTEVWEVTPDDAARYPGIEAVPSEIMQGLSGPTHGYRTGYFYDALGNLRRVQQGAQARFFAYDSLGRLLRAKNPEQGSLTPDAAGGDFPALTDASSGVSNGDWSMGYIYDANGNLRKRRDGRGTTTTYGYDDLNRNVTVSYAAGAGTAATPGVIRSYDNPAEGANGLGRLWKSEAAQTALMVVGSYDPAGRPMKQTQWFWRGGSWGQTQDAYVTTLGYNLAGGVTSQIYPSGNRVEYQYDAAGRLGDNGLQPAFKGTLGGAERTYSSQVLYDKLGGMSQERLGTDTALYNKRLYNSRGQLAEIRVGLYPLTDPDPARATSWQRGAIINDYSDTAWGVTGGGADNNGNLKKQELFIPGDDAAGYEGRATVITQSYGYDHLNRLTSAGESGAAPWAQRYRYDRFGNRTVDLSQSANVPVPQYDFERGELAGTNRLYAPGDLAYPDPSDARRRMRYDAAGNLTYDGYTGKGARTYDAENRMTSAADEGGGTTFYAYDGDGRRVKRMAGATGEVWQVYGIGGELLAEYAKDSPANQPRKEYGYRGGELLVTAEPASAGWGPPPTFTGPDLKSGDTIRLEHLTELRGAVNQLRQRAGLPAYDFTVDPSPQAKVTTVKAEHIRQLRLALEGARSKLGLPTGGYEHPTLTEKSSPIYAKDFQELRDQIKGAWQGGTSGADIRWLVTDQLGTPRMVVDRTGSLAGVTRHDYLPFGEELRAGAGGRTPGHGYSAVDNVRQKFTGYERDGESGLDYAQARYYSPVLGRFTAADDFRNDSVVGDPQSWNKYAYVRNRPLTLTDPTGEKAHVSISTDPEKRTGTIEITASFGVYAANGDVSAADLRDQADQIRDQIIATYTGKYAEGGITFTVSAKIDVQVLDRGTAETMAKDGKLDNLVSVVNSDHILDTEGRSASAWTYKNAGEDFDRMTVALKGHVANDNLYSHEFGHSLGTQHPPFDAGGHLGPGNVMQPLYTVGRSTLSRQDFGGLFGPVIREHNSRNERARMAFGARWPRMTTTHIMESQAVAVYPLF